MLRRHFEVHNAQKSLKFFLDQKLLGEDQHKWVSKLLGYDFEAKYNLGKQNSAIDAPSRSMYVTTI